MTRIASETFVGREQELLRLEEALRSSAAGAGSTVFVAGEAGIGKSRLVAELAELARAGGARFSSGRCIDLVGADLPYLPFVEAVRPLRGSPELDGLRADLHELPLLIPELVAADSARHAAVPAADTQLRLFGEMLAVLEHLSAASPLVLVLEDLHWADASTLDLFAFLAHAVRDRRILLLGTYRSDEVRSGDPLQRVLADLLRRRAAIVLELEPLEREQLAALLADLDEALPADVIAAICGRSDGNPFFAEELLAAAARGEERLPPVLRDLLLQRLARLDARSRSLARAAAAAGRDVSYGLLAAVTPLSRPDLVEALREAVEHGVLLPDETTDTFRFRHALLAEAVYGTLLPGEREALHEQLASALTEEPTLAAGRSAAAELAHHWTAAGRPAEALASSIVAAREAVAVSGLAEALRHVERAVALWDRVPAAAEPAGMDLAAALAWAAELAALTGNAPRATELVRPAIELVSSGTDPVRAGVLYERLGSYLLQMAQQEEALAMFTRAVELVPAEPPSVERVRVLGSLGYALMRPDRHEESRAVCEQAIQAAEALGDDRPAFRAMTTLGLDLFYLGRTEDGIELLLDVRQRAKARGTPHEITHAYIALADVLIAAGRLRDAAREAIEGISVARDLGLDRSHGVGLELNAAEALLGIGEWTHAGDVLSSALRSGGAFWAHYAQMLQAQLELGRGRLDAAHRHLEAGAEGAARPFSAPVYSWLSGELAWWEGRFEDALAAVENGLRVATSSELGFHRARLCALGLRAEAGRAELAAVARDERTLEAAREHALELREDARRSAGEAAVLTPDAPAWALIAEAEFGRVQGRSQPDRWRAAIAVWDSLDRPFVAAYCRWRYAEALLAAGSSSAEAARPAREAHRVARWLGARLLQRELELLAQRARLDLLGLLPDDVSLEAGEALGLTARESEVLQLLARGYTNPEIAAELTISVKTASVHVSHIMRKLNVSSRFEAAAVAHRLAPPRSPDTVGS
jgi:DNA-binding NarL/FixJ family response regulator/tetratricopeptide (TPR) repeat protein